jgi:hypothetical protein
MSVLRPPIPNHFAPIRSIRVGIDLAKCLCEQIFKKNFSMASHRWRSVLQPRLRARSQRKFCVGAITIEKIDGAEMLVAWAFL